MFLYSISSERDMESSLRRKHMVTCLIFKNKRNLVSADIFVVLFALKKTQNVLFCVGMLLNQNRTLTVTDCFWTFFVKSLRRLRRWWRKAVVPPHVLLCLLLCIVNQHLFSSPFPRPCSLATCRASQGDRGGEEEERKMWHHEPHQSRAFRRQRRWQEAGDTKDEGRVK